MTAADEPILAANPRYIAARRTCQRSGSAFEVSGGPSYSGWVVFAGVLIVIVGLVGLAC